MADIFGGCNRLHWVKCRARTSQRWLATQLLSTGDYLSWRNFGTLRRRSCFPILRLRRYSKVHGSYLSQSLLPFNRQCRSPWHFRHSKRNGSLRLDFKNYWTLWPHAVWPCSNQLPVLRKRNQGFRSKDIQCLNDSYRRRNQRHARIKKVDCRSLEWALLSHHRRSRQRQFQQYERPGWWQWCLVWSIRKEVLTWHCSIRSLQRNNQERKPQWASS